MHRSAPLQPARLLPATLPACLTRARRQLVREAGDLAGGFPGIRILGGRWRTQRSLLTWPHTTRFGAFVLPFLRRGWGVAPPGRPSSGVQPARTFFFPPSLSLSPPFLALFPFFQAPDSRGKVAFPSLPKSYASLGGGLWEQGVCCAIDPRSSGGFSAGFAQNRLIAAPNDYRVAGAEPPVRERAP